ncbi:ATP-dependent DNA helicase DinG [Zobellella maritima]|uniref:ATP-dependent DNA helicase DinG n=1 Tax=Zobellella maritima TaxID=2059725 RepID=UPI000E309CCD|nr:ATP-dependent DNA helicase DinG [Zobellella maritima]
MTDTHYRTLIRDNYRRLGAAIAGFKPRRAQNYLVAEIGRVLMGHYQPSRRILVAEAGTGIGKSLAYIQAAVPWARQAHKKLVISTATLALQEQLIEKDLPLFLRHCPPAFRFVLAKGRGRYCCDHRLAQLAEGEAQFSLLEPAAGLSSDEQTLVADLWQARQRGDWAGDRDSWPTPIDDGLWQRIQAQRHGCQPQLGHQHCPFHLARNELDKAEVIVVNHALLLADLKMGGGIILPEPEACVYVLDEAHHIADIARDQGSARLPLRTTRRWLEQFNQGLGKHTSGLNAPELQKSVTQVQDALQQQIPSLNSLQQSLTESALTTDEQGCLRFAAGELPDALHLQLVQLKEENTGLQRSLERLQTQVAEQLKLGTLPLKQAEPWLSDLSQAQLRTEQTATLCELMTRPLGSKHVPPARWLEQDDKSRDISLCATPLAVGYLLEQWCWSRAAAVIMVSATFTALNDFGYFRRAVGLKSDDGSRYLRLNSPFDYPGSRLIVPDIGCVPGDDGFDQALIEQLPHWLAQQQASLVLFSSYRQMQTVAEGLRAKGLSLLVQGEASRQGLLQLHRVRCDGGSPSVLFGTGSFSEGLDLPGHYLTNLVITKLPFAVPTSPVEEAMAEWISLRGGNPFMELTVPEASRKLIQACGRLLRSETDQGRIVLLDRRIVTRRYGAALLAALPPFTQEITD